MLAPITSTASPDHLALSNSTRSCLSSDRVAPGCSDRILACARRTPGDRDGSIGAKTLSSDPAVHDPHRQLLLNFLRVCRLWPAPAAGRSRKTCVSTTTPSALPKQTPSTTLAVLRAAPGMVISSASVSGTLPPNSATTFAAAPLIDFALLRKKPVVRISASSCGRVALAIACGVGKPLEEVPASPCSHARRCTVLTGWWLQATPMATRAQGRTLLQGRPRRGRAELRRRGRGRDRRVAHVRCSVVQAASYAWSCSVLCSLA